MPARPTPLARLLLVCVCLWLPGGVGAVPLDAATVGEWADATFNPALQAHRYSGLVVVVVKDDAVLFAKGYGYEDYARQLPVDPARTRFRIGSITKTFTALAIAQLQERGAIRSLDDPARTYLRRIPLDVGPESTVTLQHLLTHTGGFDSSAFHLGARPPVSPPPLSAEALRVYRQPLVRPPGSLAVYSNYGIALLGIAAEDVSGQSMPAYLDQHVFRPLGMLQTTLNVSGRPSADLAVPYAFLPNGEAQRVPYLGVDPFFAPAGAIEATGLDMAKYLIANIAAGRDVAEGILSPAGFERLHRRAFGNHATSSGFAMAFMTLDWNGTRFVGHGGDWPGFHSIMLFAPAERVGFFISCLCEYPQVDLLESLTGSARLKPTASVVVEAPLTNVGIATTFLTRFWGQRRIAPQAERLPLDRFVGTYWHEYRNHTGVEKLLELFGGDSALLTVERGNDTHLRINGVGGYAQIAPGVFQTDALPPTLSQNFWNSDVWAFTLEASGQARVASPLFGLDPSIRVQGIAQPARAARLGLICLIVCATGLLALFWPVTHRLARIGKWLPLVAVASIAGMVPLLQAGYAEGDGFVFALLAGDGTRLLCVVLLAYLLLIVTATMCVVATFAWRHQYWGAGTRGLARRVHYSLLTLAALGLVAVASFFNLLWTSLP